MGVTKTKLTARSSRLTVGQRCSLAQTVVVAALLMLAVARINAAVLPEDRIDILYHAYDGGGAEISGPSVLVRKGFADTVSVYANYYIDNVTSASIDVLAQGSPYEEHREEYSVGMEYLHGKTIMSLGYTNSKESDYDAETVGIGVSQDFFGDLTTISLSATYGNDEVRSNANVGFIDEATHRRYGLTISQIVTRNLIVGMSFESVVDEGYLSNPYRSDRYRDNDNTSGYTYEEENYPRTHNSDAFAIRAMYYLPYRASIRAEYRSFSDNWGIQAKMGELRYIHPIAKWGLTFEGKYRVYDQTGAMFYNDLFSFENFTREEFRGRDKELSIFSDTGVGIGVTYQLPNGFVPYFDKTTVNLFWDRINFQYEDFRNVLDPNAITAGSEIPYEFDADVIRLFFSFWY